jgi:hypothetical protein
MHSLEYKFTSEGAVQMPTNYAESLSAKKLSRKQKIEAVISDVIAEHGFRSAMNDLLPAVRNLEIVALADPDNRAKEREFLMWSKAVKNACARQMDESAFDERVSAADAIQARGMGITLD